MLFLPDKDCGERCCELSDEATGESPSVGDRGDSFGDLTGDGDSVSVVGWGAPLYGRCGLVLPGGKCRDSCSDALSSANACYT